MRLDLTKYSTEVLVDLADTYNRLADHEDVDDRWKAWSREVVEAMHLELAERHLAEALLAEEFDRHWFAPLPTADAAGAWELNG